ncbi:hypothetical protein E2F46_06480 [Luteimonas aestuarii]|uniref:ABC transporter substrate-binding protein n=1 Tax=Luteimonas aestuarii TaxID=453837 RepID=A0A4R5TYE4_9GAMM|nr:hypothetical protein [Luteimonas aestuarii]TDK26238.1 hypothetical protein E2F46_06480 [Luteimonas aestuarii]
MKKLPVLFALALSPSLVLAQQGAGTAAQPLGLGSQVRGEITTADRVNFSDGSRSVVYALDLDAGQAVRLEATGALCARLTVIHDGETVAGPTQGDCDAGSGTSTRLALMASDTGRYEVAVSGAGARAFGPFRLEAKALEVHRGDGALRPGSEIVDFLRSDGKTYRLDIRQAGYYVIDMRSTDIDSMLELSGNGVSANDDDGGDGLNSRLRVPLEPGTYTLRAKSIGDASGMFELAITTGALPAGVRLRNSGALSLDGNVLHGALSGSPREYQLRVTQPGRVTIDLGSDDFDTVLELSGNGVSLDNDDGGDGTNSRISTVLQPGAYTVIARGLGESGSGLFTLSATHAALPAGTSLRTGGDLALGTAVTGMSNGESHSYRITIAQAGQLVVDMTSDDFDAVLELQRDGEQVAEDDDGGGGTNARITTDVQPGTYTVVAKSFGGSASGMYELTARMAP